MERFEEVLLRKRRIADRYRSVFQEAPGISLMSEAAWARSNFWMYTILIDETVYGEDSRALMRRLAKHGIQSRPLWQPMHRSPACRMFQVEGGEVADRLHRDGLTLPCSAALTFEDQSRVLDAIQTAVH